SIAGVVSLSAATSAMSSAAFFSFLIFLASPISFEAALRRAWAVSSSRIFLRRASSKAISRFASGASPRRASARSKASGCSRMKRMSCMSLFPCHGRTCSGHPRLWVPILKTWMPGSSPGMTNRTKNIRHSLRRLSGRRRGARRRRAPLHYPHRPDRALVKRDQRHGKRQLAQHVGRGEHGGNDKGNHDEVAAFRFELIGGDDADAPEQCQDDRKLKRHAEGEDQLHHQRQIIFHLRQ